jgi:hypothetical protein
MEPRIGHQRNALCHGRTVGVLLECHVEFEAGGRTRAVKGNDALRIVE